MKPLRSTAPITSILNLAFRWVRSGDTDVSLAIKIEAKHKEQLQIEDAAQQRALYEELLFAVGNKYPGETRHQTALRYIKQAEVSRHSAGKSEGKS